jgi:hypothetical protein
MSGNATTAKPTLGFLTAVNHPEHGLFGGYLILNLHGRPLEFHCTLPIKPNRAQEILYGPTLEAFLYGEQIAQTLLGEGKHQPLVALTDRQPMLAAAEFTRIPLALVLPPADEEPSGVALPGGLSQVEVGRNRLGVRAKSPDEARRIVERLADLDGSFDLAEPFERIVAAIEEARKAALQAA